VKQAVKPQDVMTTDGLFSHCHFSELSIGKFAQDGRMLRQKSCKHWWFNKDAIDQRLDKQKHTIASGSCNE